MALKDAMPSVLLENVVSLIHAKVPNSQAKQVEQFATCLYAHMSKDDLNARNDSDLYGAVLSLWNALNKTPKGETHLRVFNPSQSKHGWQSTHSIIEVIQPDMPFLVDSVGMALNRMGITAHMMLHTPLAIERSAQEVTKVTYLKQSPDSTEQVAVFLIEIDRQNSSADIKALEREIQSVLGDVAASVNDWEAMSAKLSETIKDLPKRPFPGEKQELEEAINFLTYLNNHHFTLLGYRQYDLKRVEGDVELVPNMASSLGLMNKHHKAQPEQGLLLSSFSDSARKEALDHSLLILTKSSAKSRVHRPAYVDYIGIKRFDKKGNVVGEDRFIGLYASNVYNRSPREIPLLNEKVQRVLDRSGLTPRSHDYKALLNILENLPRDELIQANVEDLAHTAHGVLEMQDRDKLKLFVRKDGFGRFLSCLVYVSKDRYNTKLRQDTQRILAQHFNSKEDVEFTTYFSESTLARTHYIVKVDNNNMDVDVAAIENNLIEAARSWEDKLNTALNNALGEEAGTHLMKRYANAFEQSYKEDVLPSSAVVDMQQLEALDDEHKLGMLFYQPQEAALNDNKVRLKLFHKDEPIHLSDVLPMLENFGLRVINERPYEVTTSDGSTFWILDFLMTVKVANTDNIADSQDRFQTALSQVWQKKLEDDGFNRIILASGLTGREVSVLRAYAKYMRQIDATFSQAYIEETFGRYPQIADLLVKMFIRKFNPKLKTRTLGKFMEQINLRLDEVSSLDDDRIIRRYLDLINATLRTNFYQLDAKGEPKSYISFKFMPSMIPEMPRPLPKFEIFVYSPRVEGVHLRGGKVARGGLRWSDRREDFRTEVLGLVKAQQVKNTVIVPVGAKGGFVCKQLPTEGGREAFFTEGQECYRIFIRALLDITDNIVNGEIVHPVDVVRHDEDDPYLVVAADKGTATFSDIANAISQEYNFWLGDAFASGGSNGYDHKKMGITAKGGWESVKRHFREVGIDCQTTDFTCLGIGDMAGDVFGNGMLLSKHTKLVAAFNHMHIFIDPNPDAAASYEERARLFALPRSSWEDYNSKLISKGGGIFLRSSKSIPLSAEMKQMLETEKASMTPTELMKELLKMPVDLIWNGGIGTYVKSSRETNAEVGDRANDALRVNGRELRAKIVGEGGNLGCTQLGRIEYAANGGRINTDFVDNVGGVDCSDNEVNIKILLNALVAEGELTLKQRNRLLEEMTEEVGQIVLQDCKDQTRTISVTQVRGAEQLKEQIRFIQYLEKEGKLDRALEFLPSEEELAERLANGRALTRPELSVLVAYAKMVLKEQLLTPEITEDTLLSQLLIAYFPKKLQELYSHKMVTHPLRGEIIATSLANELVNDMGLNFVQRMQDETGASVADAAICYTMAREVFGLAELTKSITDLNGIVPAVVQGEMLHQLRRNMRRACRWFLRHRNRSWSIEQTVAFFKPVFEQLKANVHSYLVEEEAAGIQAEINALIKENVPQDVASTVANMSTLFSTLDIAQIAQTEEKTVALVAETYFKLGARVELHWFLEQISAQPVTNHWQALARAAFREELDWQQRALTSVVLRTCSATCNAQSVISQWIDTNQALLERWFHMLADFKTSQSHEFAKFSVALRELNLLILHCEGQK
ncbi:MULTISPECIES: NAD-glutamate dehydrogenase [Shewanella]|uniref:NAD-glutamate dehydrogenase n=1 Tax=Shewanella xiamenensis TaxID=332186 RepID=A0AAW6QX41_9GAMM|nr:MULTISPECIES: NAD-glutamate dehydrogenase [Shewanella]PZP35907.1 MAG: NAD-glutamate dehydrogenase [Shewanella oneidensis]ASF14141.1 NAD-glutamate dehydrogenase [Shewanella sp. FDAARGOS_354]KEK28090.1 glutamate dehydrogenase (NAD) [Shewanella xiamenensis]KPN75728.1 NAD-glutamate dehydrogenase [Shewanella sp. Sh95]MBW0281737.1 NAD-glutamate dehydrogenase [Shewanella xiamenensis]